MILSSVSHERRSHGGVRGAGGVHSGAGAAHKVGRRRGASIPTTQTRITAAGHSVESWFAARRRPRRRVGERVSAARRRRRQEIVLSGAFLINGRVSRWRRCYVATAARRRRAQRRHPVRMARCVTHFRLVDAVSIHVHKQWESYIII